MATLDDIRAALATAAATVDGWQGYDHVPGQINTPCAITEPEGTTFDVDLDDGATYIVPVRLLVSLGDWESAQRLLDPQCSHDGPMVAALNAVTGFDCQVQRMQDYGLTQHNGVDYLGALLVVEVFA